MVRYEYKSVDINPKQRGAVLEAVMNDLGKLGWQFIHVSPMVVSIEEETLGQPICCLWFMRSLPD